MNRNKVSRRSFCSVVLGRGILLLGAGTFIAGCGGSTKEGDHKEKPDTAESLPSGGDPCTDFSGIVPSELDKRKALGYVEKSPIPDNLCENCKLFIPGRPGAGCGGCQLFKGPVFLDAYCTYWADPDV